jgi:hypothetical protein
LGGVSPYFRKHVVFRKKDAPLWIEIRICRTNALLELASSSYHTQPHGGFAMNGFDGNICLWALVGVQFFGIVSAVTARLSEGTHYQMVSQRVFCCLLPLVGGANIFSLTIGPSAWLACSATFSVMVLMVTCDFQNDRVGAMR